MNRNSTGTLSLAARRVQRLAILEPLGIRDFALLFSAMAVSLLGDGIYLVAIAWQVYELSNAPTALSIVGVAWTTPLVVFILIGGVVSDRLDRRKVMIVADVVRAVAIGILAALSITGMLELWHVLALVGLYGAGEAFFGPAFAAIVPDIVPSDRLVQANSLNQLMRPAALQLGGPALGGLTIAALGAGGAFALDAATFILSAAVLSLMRPRHARRGGDLSSRSVREELGEGFRFVRAHTWLWGTLVAAGVALLAYWGPTEVLIPFLVKNELGGGADDLGLVFAAGGVGAILSSLVMAERGLPRRHITFMYVMWGAGTLALAAYGVVDALWQAMIVSFAIGAVEAAAFVVWMTLVHRLVPSELLGRVESFDWLIAVGLVPVSFALTGPIAGAVGVQTTLIGAGIMAGAVTLLFLFLPGVRDTERDEAISGTLR